MDLKNEILLTSDEKYKLFRAVGEGNLDFVIKFVEFIRINNNENSNEFLKYINLKKDSLLEFAIEAEQWGVVEYLCKNGCALNDILFTCIANRNIVLKNYCEKSWCRCIERERYSNIKAIKDLCEKKPELLPLAFNVEGLCKEILTITHKNCRYKVGEGDTYENISTHFYKTSKYAEMIKEGNRRHKLHSELCESLWIPAPIIKIKLKKAFLEFSRLIDSNNFLIFLCNYNLIDASALLLSLIDEKNHFKDVESYSAMFTQVVSGSCCSSLSQDQWLEIFIIACKNIFALRYLKILILQGKDKVLTEEMKTFLLCQLCSSCPSSRDISFLVDNNWDINGVITQKPYRSSEKSNVLWRNEENTLNLHTIPKNLGGRCEDDEIQISDAEDARERPYDYDSAELTQITSFCEINPGSLLKTYKHDVRNNYFLMSISPVVSVLFSEGPEFFMQLEHYGLKIETLTREDQNPIVFMFEGYISSDNCISNKPFFRVISYIYSKVGCHPIFWSLAQALIRRPHHDDMQIIVFKKLLEICQKNKDLISPWLESVYLCIEYEKPELLSLLYSSNELITVEELNNFLITKNTLASYNLDGWYWMKKPSRWRPTIGALGIYGTKTLMNLMVLGVDLGIGILDEDDFYYFDHTEYVYKDTYFERSDHVDYESFCSSVHFAKSVTSILKKDTRFAKYHMLRSFYCKPELIINKIKDCLIHKNIDLRLNQDQLNTYCDLLYYVCLKPNLISISGSLMISQVAIALYHKIIDESKICDDKRLLICGILLSYSIEEMDVERYLVSCICMYSGIKEASLDIRNVDALFSKFPQKTLRYLMDSAFYYKQALLNSADSFAPLRLLNYWKIKNFYIRFYKIVSQLSLAPSYHSSLGYMSICINDSLEQNESFAAVLLLSSLCEFLFKAKYLQYSEMFDLYDSILKRSDLKAYIVEKLISIDKKIIQSEGGEYSRNSFYCHFWKPQAHNHSLDIILYPPSIELTVKAQNF